MLCDSTYMSTKKRKDQSTGIERLQFLGTHEGKKGGVSDSQWHRVSLGESVLQTNAVMVAQA